MFHSYVLVFFELVFGIPLLLAVGAPGLMSCFIVLYVYMANLRFDAGGVWSLSCRCWVDFKVDYVAGPFIQACVFSSSGLHYKDSPYFLLFHAAVFVKA